LCIANLANIKWEGVPDFEGYYPEGSLAELESAKISPSLTQIAI